MFDSLTTNFHARSAARPDTSLLSSDEFNAEIVRERIRATRRAIPFCLVTLDLLGRNGAKQSRVVEKLLLRNLRITDRKSRLGKKTFCVLLVDTPEMGGRCVMDRLRELCERNEIRAELSLRVHDPGGFRGCDRDDQRGSEIGVESGRSFRRIDQKVEVSGEEPVIAGSFFQALVKRTIDIVGSAFGLLATGPLIIAGMVAVKLSSPGPALFMQTREGRHGKPFRIYKLRTMLKGAEEFQEQLRAESHRDGPAFKIKQDPRVTKLGGFLRASCIDELPQLWNVLKGDMSLVGPRPLPWHESRACNHWHRRRLDVRPGMTCHWQVNKAAAETFDDWMRMDLRYISEMGVFTDLCLIAKTVTVPILARGSE